MSATAGGAGEREEAVPQTGAADAPPAGDGATRRGFLVRSTLLVTGAALGGAAAGCDGPPVPGRAGDGRAAGGSRAGLDGPTLRALADAVLPESLGTEGRAKACEAFVAWAMGFEPVAQEMLGYGDAEVRFLPADPIPGWRSQLDALERLAARRGTAFPALPVPVRRAVIEQALGRNREARLPAPLVASHVALALLAHWTSSAEGWNLALGARIDRDRCRSLDATTAAPAPLGDA